MATQKINYTNKVDLNIDSSIADINKVVASDMNQIKSVVNNNADEFDNLNIPNIVNSYSTSTQDGYSCKYVNEKTGILLWENQSPTSSFAGQDVNLNSSDYNYLEIYYKFSNGSNQPMKSDRAIKGYNMRLMSSSTFGGQGGGEMARRDVTYVNATKLTFGDGIYQKGTTETTGQNQYAIPVIIIGYK